MRNVYGEQLIKFLESIGCNKRGQIGEHVTMWSVFTGHFFIVPIYSEVLDELTLKHIIWQLGLTESGFLNMWEQKIHITEN